MERLVIARRISCAETEPLGRHPHDREHGHRVHFHAADAVADGVRVVMPVDVRHRKPVVEEAEVEFAFFEHPADMPVVVRRPGIGTRLRVAPGARKVGAILRLQKGNQGHLAHRRLPSNLEGAAQSRRHSMRSALANLASLPDRSQSIGSKPGLQKSPSGRWAKRRHTA